MMSSCQTWRQILLTITSRRKTGKISLAALALWQSMVRLEVPVWGSNSLQKISIKQCKREVANKTSQISRPSKRQQPLPTHQDRQDQTLQASRQIVRLLPAFKISQERVTILTHCNSQVCFSPRTSRVQTAMQMQSSHQSRLSENHPRWALSLPHRLQCNRASVLTTFKPEKKS